MSRRSISTFTKVENGIYIGPWSVDLWSNRFSNKYFELKKTCGPKLELLASNGVATFVMPFSITLNARYTHIKQTHTCIHRHTHAHAQTHTHTRVVCMCVHVCAHGNPQNHT